MRPRGPGEWNTTSQATRLCGGTAVERTQSRSKFEAGNVFSELPELGAGFLPQLVRLVGEGGSSVRLNERAIPPEASAGSTPVMGSGAKVMSADDGEVDIREF